MTTALEKKIGYKFSDAAVLEQALTHSSLHDLAADNERLEFLGDRVLGLIVADLLYKQFPDEKEGGLAKRHTALVQQETLVSVAHVIGLGEHLKLSPSEKKSGGLKKDTILSDAIEALIGGVYMDGGYKAAHALVSKFWSDMLTKQAAPPEDAKSRLQEWAQGRALPLPEYKLVKKSGTDHSPQFEIEVKVKGMTSVTATASSKRAAEKAAAVKILEQIGKEKNEQKGSK